MRLPGKRREDRLGTGLVHGVELVAGRSATVPFTFRSPRAGARTLGLARSAELRAHPGTWQGSTRRFSGGAPCRHRADARGRSGSRSGPRSRGRRSSPSLAVEALDPAQLAGRSDGASSRVGARGGGGARRVVSRRRSRSSSCRGPISRSRTASFTRWTVRRCAGRQERLWFWQGCGSPSRVATRREQLGPADVFAERNLERRRVLVEVLGFENLARAASGGEPAQQDDYGRLWRLGPLLDDEEYVAVEVVNSTPGAGRLVPPLLPPRATGHQDRPGRRRLDIRAERPRLHARRTKLIGRRRGTDTTNQIDCSSGSPTRSPAGAASATTGSLGPRASRRTYASCCRRPGR